MTARCLLKAEAAARGATRYTSSTPCSKGHGFERLVVNGTCVECAKEYRREAYRKNPAQRVSAREGMRRLRKADPVGVRMRQSRSRLNATYGLTQPEYEMLFGKQNGACPICYEAITSRFDTTQPMWSGSGSVTNDFARVDHCHLTSAVRGLLCSNCNILLGKAKDSETILLNAVGYLRASATQQAQPVAEREAVSEIEPGNRDLDSNVCRGNRRDQLSPFF